MQANDFVRAGTLVVALAFPSTLAAQDIHASGVFSLNNKGQLGGGIFVPSNALGPPSGGGLGSGSKDVYSLGIGGHLTLGLSVVLTDGPGADFIVSENPFQFNPGESFSEMAFVEVSSDGVQFVRFPSAYYGPPVDPGPFGVVTVGTYSGLAGATPVLAGNPMGPPADPQDVVEAGGDAFDLRDLKDDPLVLGGQVDLRAITQIRLVDAVSGADLDSRGLRIFDPGSGSADIDAVTVIHHQGNVLGNGPHIALTIPRDGRFELIIEDPDGWQDLDPTSLRASVRGVPVPVTDILGLTTVTRADQFGFTLQFPLALPRNLIFQLAFSVKDRSGQRSGASRARPDGL